MMKKQYKQYIDRIIKYQTKINDQTNETFSKIETYLSTSLFPQTELNEDTSKSTEENIQIAESEYNKLDKLIVHFENTHKTYTKLIMYINEWTNLIQLLKNELDKEREELIQLNEKRIDYIMMLYKKKCEEELKRKEEQWNKYRFVKLNDHENEINSNSISNNINEENLQIQIEEKSQQNDNISTTKSNQNENEKFSLENIDLNDIDEILSSEESNEIVIHMNSPRKQQQNINQNTQIKNMKEANNDVNMISIQENKERRRDSMETKDSINTSKTITPTESFSFFDETNLTSITLRDIPQHSQNIQNTQNSQKRKVITNFKKKMDDIQETPIEITSIIPINNPTSLTTSSPQIVSSNSTNLNSSNTSTIHYKRKSLQNPKEIKDKDNVEDTYLLPNEFNLQKEEQIKIQQWTNKKFGNILFHSKYDDWEVGKSTFHSKIIGKSEIVILIETDSGERCGGFVSETIEVMNSKEIENENNQQVNDKRTFLFTFQSNLEPMTFSIKEKKRTCSFRVYDETNEILFDFGGNDLIVMKKGLWCSCYQKLTSSFDYGEYKKALIGKTGKQAFYATNIIVYQMI